MLPATVRPSDASRGSPRPIQPTYVNISSRIRGAGPSPGLSPRDLRGYRVLTLAAGAFILAFHSVYRIAVPDAIDPFWQRVVLAALCFGVFTLSYFYRGGRFHYVVYVAYYAVTLWVVQLNYLNGLAPEYALGLVVVVSAISAAFREQRHLLWYVLVILACFAVAAALVPSPRMDSLLVASYVAVVCTLSYIIIGTRLAAQAEIAASEERYALAALGANDGLWDWDLRRDRVFYSARWKAMLGYAEGEVGDSPSEWFGRIHRDDAAQVARRIESYRRGATPHFEIEHRVLHRDGEYRWMLSRGVALGEGGEGSSRMAGSLTDVTERRRVEEQLLHNALYDGLTGLPNRALLMDRLELAVRRRKRQQDSAFAVLFVDLDRFKLINDGLGHPVGDDLLVAVARRLEVGLRQEDTVARLGGDEFVILLEEAADVGEATRVAERILAELERPFELGNYQIFSSASIGIAMGGGDDRAEDLVRDADTAMYRAKSEGKSRVALFDAEMHAEAMARLHREADLRRALERDEIRVHYQPIVSLETGRLVGFEALARWEHPVEGLLHPAEFIPMAEETGLIVQVGARVLRGACRQLREWLDAWPLDPPLVLSVNLSARQFGHPTLLREIDEVLAETGIEPSMLQLELTESLLMRDAESTVAALRQIRSRGIRLAIDDFGTGYSSLSYLQRFPIGTLKIDRSFVRGLTPGSNQSELVQTMVSLARGLGMSVVAEGIETVEQLTELRRLGCASAQGFLFARPLAPDAAVALLTGVPLGWAEEAGPAPTRA
ncbi:MAG TPA: EAL domain-containing protein [Longimicrobiaceae bacterium]|nr:EAL domain-containing protein [Longimicrobiaceae bacterium]